MYFIYSIIIFVNAIEVLIRLLTLEIYNRYDVKDA